MKHLNKYKKIKINPLFGLFIIALMLLTTTLISTNYVYARPTGPGLANQLNQNGQQSPTTDSNTCQSGNPNGSPKCCGEGPNAVETSIDLGCTGKGNPILDMLFAFIRFLSAGVGVVAVFSTILAGIQYTVSRDSPESTQKAKGRLVSNVIALAVFIFAYSIMNFLIPGGFFNG